MGLFTKYLLEKKEQNLSDVKTKWHPPEGFFEKSAKLIAKGLKDNSKDLKQAMARLNFYRNRAGKNLSEKDQARLKHAAEFLHSLYTDK